eukprot:g5978.t1
MTTVPEQEATDACCQGPKSAFETLKSALSATGRALGWQLKRSAEELHQVLGAGQGTGEIGDKVVTDPVEKAAIFAQKSPQQGKGGVSPYQRAWINDERRLNNLEDSEQAASEYDWVLAQRYSGCITEDASGSAKVKVMVKDAVGWVRRPSDVVNALSRLQKQEKNAAPSSEMTTLRSAFPAAGILRRLIGMYAALRQRGHLETSRPLTFTKIGIMRYMNAIDIGHLRDTVLPAIKRTCAGKGLPVGESKNMDKKTSFLQIPEELPSTLSAVAWPTPAGNVTSFLQSTSWTKHGSSEHQNLAEDVMLAPDERDQEGSEDENAAIEVN